jgi:hypothetical protein
LGAFVGAFGGCAGGGCAGACACSDHLVGRVLLVGAVGGCL